MYSACKLTPDGIRLTSGMVVYDEKLINGKLVCRYLNAAGQILPELHLSDALFAVDQGVFSLRLMSGETLDSGWMLTEREALSDSSRLLLRHETQPIEVELMTKADGTGWFTRAMMLYNLSDQPLALAALYPFRGVAFRHVFSNGVLSYDTKECDLAPTELYQVGYTHQQAWGTEGDFAFRPLHEEGLRYDSGFHGRCGWCRPAYILQDMMTSQLINVEFAYSGNWHMNIQPEKTATGIQLCHEIGFSTPEGESLRVLAPGERLEIPLVHFTCCAQGMEKLIHSRHAFIRKSIMPASDPLGKARIEANHRGYLCNAENEPGIIEDMELAARAGVELYVIDAGWFGRLPNDWFNNAGDWFCAEWLPNDLQPIIAHARKLGMKFGLWMEPEAAGSNTMLREQHPEFLLCRYGEPVSDGRALNLADPAVVTYVENQISNVISRYQLDMFRVDHNHHMLQGGTVENSGYVENLTWRYYDNLYAMYGRLREKFPQVSFQSCAAGGGRLDLGILKYFHHTEISDWARPPRDMKLFTGMLTQLPPEIQLRICGTEVCEHVQAYDLLSSVHSILQGRLIFRGISPTVEELNPELISLLKEKTDLYKTQLRPILTGDCLTFIHAPLNGVLEPWQYAANEYALPDKSAAYAVVQQLSPKAEPITLRFSHVDMNSNYQVTLDRRQAGFTLSGRELALYGIPLLLNNMLETELILIQRLE